MVPIIDEIPCSLVLCWQVLEVKYPDLQIISGRILDIYFLLSSGGHQGAGVTEAEATISKHLTYDGRLISTRYCYPDIRK